MYDLEKQSNHHFSYTIAINTTLEKVWQTLIDVEKWPVWDTELQSAKLLSDFILEAKGTMIPKKGPKLKFYISEITTNKSYTFNTKMPLGELVIKRTIIEKNNQIFFTDDIKFTGILKKIYGSLLGKGFKKVVPEVMQNFKNLAESK